MSSEVDPVVSVIVTTKNEDRNIGACLESVVQQSMPPLEMIVVDNFSEDKTAEIAQEYGAKVFQLGPERSAQRNYGVEKAHGVYILYLDADMRLSPKVIEECVNCCEADSGVSGIYIPENSDCDEKWWGIAVRIEDDILISENGPVNLSGMAPRKAEEIEKIMKQPSPLDSFKLPKLD